MTTQELKLKVLQAIDNLSTIVTDNLDEYHRALITDKDFRLLNEKMGVCVLSSVSLAETIIDVINSADDLPFTL